jgi:RNA polymerase sigma-70 factor (ECF subfamily)
VSSPLSTSETADLDLITAARRGDRQAFGELVCRYRQGVVGVIYRMLGDPLLADDVAQDAFLRAWQRLETYKPQYSFRNWLFSIATHLALDMLRRERETVDVDEAPLRSPEAGPEAEMETQERVDAVRSAVLALSPAARAVLVLREYESLSYQEIADMLHIPLGTVMSRLNYARSQLRQSLAHYMEAG